MCPSEEESDPTFAAAGTSGLGKVNVVLADLGKKQQEKCRGAVTFALKDHHATALLCSELRSTSRV